MEFLVDQLHFLGLNEKEIKVFTVLSTFGRMNMTKISSRAGIARTTVDAIVRRLLEQGLVVQERVGGHFEYVVQLEKVADTLDWIEQRLRPAEGLDDTDTKERAPAVQDHDVPLSGTIVGHAQLHATVGDAFSAHTGERVMMLVAALVQGDKRMERLEHCLVHAREAHVRLEMLTTTNVSETLSAYARELLALLSTYDLRLNFLPPSFCIDYTDVIAFRDLVLVIDHHSDTVERITQTRSVAAMNHLLRVAREAGWGMDIRMWLEGIISSQQ